MKLFVIGHSVEDHITSAEGEIIKPGGIFYTALALTAIKKDDEIFLCTSAEKENYSLFSEVYGKCNSGFIQFTDPIPKVLLTIHGEKEREERYKNISRNLEIPYSRLKEFDGILINMITGYDINLDQLKEIRKNFSGIIYMDIHTLSRGMGHHGHRGFRQIENFPEWASCIDIIQANEMELKTLTDKTGDEDIVREILSYGTRQILLTKGSAGAYLFYLLKGGLNFIFKSAAKVKAENKIGLGDVFGAVYFYNYIKTNDLYHSLDAAVTASGLAAEMDGLIKLKSI
jgi:hypothetical protein